MSSLFGYISGVLSVLCYIPYIRDVIKGTTKPERASWLIWLVLGSIAFFSQLARGASDSLWLPGIQTLGVGIVFFLATKLGVGGFVKRDFFALGFAGVGLILWYFTSEPAIALFIVIAIDAAAGWLTVSKTYEHPESETMSAWLLSGCAGIFAVLSVGKFDPVLLSYPFYIFLINFAVVGAILLGFRKQKLSR